MTSDRRSGPTSPAGRVRGLLHRLGGRLHALDAVSAQLVQALTSFLLSLVAVRELDAAGLGVFALLYSCVVLATAVTTGLVGDSLTVLDRSRTEVRGGLQVVALTTAALGGVLGLLITWATGLLGPGEALLLGLAVMAFVLEELVRRHLMAELRFWSVVTVDASCLVVTLGWLLGTSAFTGSLVMRDLLAAILVAQLVGLVVGIVLLPAAERTWASMSGADWRAVWRYGSWRAAQQAVRPASMAVVRTLLVMAVGATVFGELEATRVYAPSLLVVNGVGGYLFASFAGRRDASLHALLRLADRGVAWLVMLSLGLGVLSVVLLPWLGPIVTGGQFELSALAVFGWAVYAAFGAVLMPYGGLAAVRGRQATVMWLRVLETVLSVGALAVMLWWTSIPVDWTPYVIGVGALVVGVVLRQGLLGPAARRDRAARAVAGVPGPTTVGKPA